MEAENILVVAVDGLRAAALGAYGNTTFSTPAMDQFAADSRLYDWCFAESVELSTIYRSLWQGEQPLLKSLAENGFCTTLLSDEPEIVACEAASDFHDCIQLPPVDPARASDVLQTAIARVFATACEQIERPQLKPRCLWVHARGMYGPWDAPLELQESLLARDEGDPPPEDGLESPDFELTDTSDPDTAFRWSCAYAAQTMALDACIDGLCRTLAEVGSAKWLVVLLGVRGFPLGEHGRVGGLDRRLYAEQLQVPLIWRFPAASGRLSRSAQLVTLADLSSALLATVRSEFRLPERDYLMASDSTGARAIRTAEWSLPTGPFFAAHDSGDESRCELYVRPDDRWEANDVAALCPEVVADLLARLAEPRVGY